MFFLRKISYFVLKLLISLLFDSEYIYLLVVFRNNFFKLLLRLVYFVLNSFLALNFSSSLSFFGLLIWHVSYWVFTSLQVLNQQRFYLLLPHTTHHPLLALINFYLLQTNHILEWRLLLLAIFGRTIGWHQHLIEIVSPVVVVLVSLWFHSYRIEQKWVWSCLSLCCSY